MDAKTLAASVMVARSQSRQARRPSAGDGENASEGHAGDRCGSRKLRRLPGRLWWPRRTSQRPSRRLRACGTAPRRRSHRMTELEWLQSPEAQKVANAIVRWGYEIHTNEQTKRERAENYERWGLTPGCTRYCSHGRHQCPIACRLGRNCGGTCALPKGHSTPCECGGDEYGVPGSCPA